MLKPLSGTQTILAPNRTLPAREREKLENEPTFQDVAQFTLEKPVAKKAVSTPVVAPQAAPVLQQTTAPVPVTVSDAIPEAPAAQALGSRPGPVLFKGFLKVRSYELDIQRPEGVQTVQLSELNGPGHNCAMVGTIGLAADGTPQFILKKGDTRLSRQLRGDDYVKIGPTGGRLDHVGQGAEKIGLSETAEELGGTPVEGSFRRLGGKLSPTMPGESTEADAYFSAIVQLGGKIAGDGGGMEALGLIGPKVLDHSEYEAKLDNGEIADAGRTRTSYGRTLDSLGYLPQLGVYVHDQPALKAKFSTLGLGDSWDPRGNKPPDTAPAPDEAAPGSHPELIDHAVFTKRNDVPLGVGVKMVDAETSHATTINGVSTPEPGKFPNQVMCTNYDRAKVVAYYNDPAKGPMVYFPDCERPLMALKATAFGTECDPSLDNTNLVRKDLLDFKVDRDEDAAEKVARVLASDLKVSTKPHELCASNSASSGQSDLYYHYFAAEVDKPPAGAKFIPLAEALTDCRTGDGDSQSEATLLMLTKQLNWIPELGMSVDDARKLMK